MGFIELIYDYFEDHVRAAGVVKERRPLAFGVLCFLIGGVSLFMAQALSQRLFFSVSWSSCALVLLWKLSAGFLLVAVLHLILDMEGYQGSAAGLFVHFGLAELAWAMAIPMIIVARLSPGGFSWIAPLIFFFVGLLSIGLKARSLQDNYNLSAGRAWMTLSIPYLAVFLVGLLAFSLALISLIMQFVKGFN
ncbi:MAG: hypothetical protein A3J74_02070 [Elusimicrobia bacterium RIFCSPHIGHO2_02_FULL_57_9]|nr:MAG: hypothetical protein A3J74_02070 [Elusimicrobia bacterium RIFCSPHIGHO2_02_FULL_57_9]